MKIFLISVSVLVLLALVSLQCKYSHCERKYKCLYNFQPISVSTVVLFIKFSTNFIKIYLEIIKVNLSLYTS